MLSVNGENMGSAWWWPKVTSLALDPVNVARQFLYDCTVWDKSQEGTTTKLWSPRGALLTFVNGPILLINWFSATNFTALENEQKYSICIFWKINNDFKSYAAILYLFMPVVTPNGLLKSTEGYSRLFSDAWIIAYWCDCLCERNYPHTSSSRLQAQTNTYALLITTTSTKRIKNKCHSKKCL